MKLLLTFLILSTTCLAQAAEAEKPEVEKKKALTGFEWLKQFEGEWSTAFSGTMKSRIVGKRWLINEISFAQGVYSVQTIGYDAKKKKFIGTWVDASSDHIWNYDGALESDGKVLVLNANGPDLQDPKKTRKYRDKYEFKPDGTIALTSEMIQDDGTWKAFGKSTMKKKATKEKRKQRPAADDK